MHLHVNAVSLCCEHVCILYLLILFTRVNILCALPPHTAYPMFVHGVHVLCMVCTFCAWCARSVNGCSLSISTSQARFQPLYIYMCMYIEVAVCHFIYYPTTSV